MILAGIDIGTNATRLLIAEIRNGFFRELHTDRIITRLGQDLDRTKRLSREARERTLRALVKFSDAGRRYGALKTAAVGTSALRTASNSDEYLRDVKKKTGIAVEVISGAEEARLTLRGVTASLAAMGRTGGFGSPPLTLIDIGGGSTEIIVRRPATKPRTVSLPLGAVYLTERFIRTDPPAVQALNGMRDAVREELFRSIKLIQPASAGLFIGTAGTISTLAAIVQGLETYDAARIDRTVLDREAVDDIVRTLGSMTVRERTSVRGLEPGREDIILAGAVIAQEIMRWSRHTSLLVIEWGLREGIVLDLAEKLNQKHRSARVGRLEKRQRE